MTIGSSSRNNVQFWTLLAGLMLMAFMTRRHPIW